MKMKFIKVTLKSTGEIAVVRTDSIMLAFNPPEQDFTQINFTNSESTPMAVVDTVASLAVKLGIK